MQAYSGWCVRDTWAECGRLHIKYIKVKNQLFVLRVIKNMKKLDAAHGR